MPAKKRVKQRQEEEPVEQQAEGPGGATGLVAWQANQEKEGGPQG